MVNSQNIQNLNIQRLNIQQVHPDPEQPRTIFQKIKMNELRESIEKNGILTPLIVESNYKGGEQKGKQKGKQKEKQDGEQYLIIDGERRYRIARELNFTEVPVYIIKGPLSYQDRTVKRFHIQEQHSSWNVFDKAQSINRLKQQSDLTIAQIAAKINYNPSIVHNWISILSFSKDSQTILVNKNILFTHLIYLVRILKRYLLASDMSQVDIERYIIKKIEIDKSILTTQNLLQWSQILIDPKDYDEKTRFLMTDKYTFDNFVLNTNEGKITELKIFYQQLSRFAKLLQEVQVKKLQFSEEHKSLGSRICSLLKKL